MGYYRLFDDCRISRRPVCPPRSPKAGYPLRPVTRPPRLAAATLATFLGLLAAVAATFLMSTIFLGLPPLAPFALEAICLASSWRCRPACPALTSSDDCHIRLR